MKVFVTYLKDYLRKSSLISFLFTLVFVVLLIFLNYTIGIERRIRVMRPWPLSLMSFFFFYGFVLFFSWAVQYTFGNRPSLSGSLPLGTPTLSYKKRFLLLLLIAPLYFSCKMIHWDLSLFIPAGWSAPWKEYALIVLQLPCKLLLLFFLIYVYWRLETPRMEGKTEGRGIGAAFGLTVRGFRGRPYFLILLFLVPLVVLASTRPDFLHTYPKVKNIAFIGGCTTPLWPWQLLYEVSYGLDFLSIELFFRGLLVIGLARYAGEYAILPMAAFYCTIHFGKPLGECISSFFGGLALGVIALRTRSILGGLIVHLGLAWLMELGGWLGALYFLK
ncbi:MAG TPA: CPBP family intramembrane glutamic endopeptidase [Puia sp.]|nr:CPBP family intramembrane glutamic endopeptidase [Puia sp.]